MEQSIDRKSFILGMTTAFSECVARECKKMALTPPFYLSDYESVFNEIEEIAKEQGLKIWYEKNLDISEGVRVCWFVIYEFPEVLKEDQELRRLGFNPAWDFDKFWDILSYGIAWGENAEEVVPKMRERKTIKDTVSRILFEPNEWPPAKIENNGV